MEDEGFVDDDFIQDTAREFFARYGLSSIPLLRERAELAEATGDYLSAQTWRAILEAAEHLVE
jgi:hypothetical protein